MPAELFELKVIVEADGWHDLSDLMATVDDALEPHRATRDDDRRWSVVANRLPAGQAQQLLWFIDQFDRCGRPAPDRLSA
ncbi:hypothetical protein BH23ACT10_BH23ACT10_28390 [soil metagenome]